MASTYDMRAWSSFNATDQAKMRAGGEVTGGDGRRFVWLNGHAVTVGSATYKAGMEQRARNAAAAAPRPTPAAPANLPGGSDSPYRRPGAGTSGPGGVLPTSDGTSRKPEGGASTTGPPGPPISDASPEQLAEEQVDRAVEEANAARQRDAKARILSVLAEYGLESLADFVWQQILNGKSDTEVLQDIRNTPEFEKRFPAIKERTKKGLAPISPGEYVAYERQARQLMRASGLPESFYDTNDDFTGWLARDVSITELNERIDRGRQALYEGPQDVRDALMRDYGVSEGGMIAFFLDPDRAQPLLEKQYRAAQIGGASTRTGFGATTRVENEQLATLGVTGEQAQQGFSTLANSKELFGSLDAGEDTIGRDEQLGAAFGGSSAAQRRIEQRKRRRQGQFEAGGSFAAGQGGVAGLGSNSP